MIRLSRLFTARMRRLSLRDDRGHTMSELVTVMFLLGVVLAIVVSVFTSFSQTFTKDRAVTDSARTANIGMNELTRVVRSEPRTRCRGRPSPIRSSSSRARRR